MKEKKKEIVSTLNAIELPGRQCGNTTRQVNYAVDMMFLGYRVKFEEHAANKMNRNDARHLNRELLDSVLTRLKNEHRYNGDEIEFGKIKIDSLTLTIELIEVWKYQTDWVNIIFGETVIYESKTAEDQRWVTGAASAQPWMEDQMKKGLLRIRK